MALFAGLRGLLAAGGRIVNLVSSPDIYVNEWASFTTKRFAGNFTAKPGDHVYTEMTDVDDRRPVQDVFWPHEAYLDVYARAGLEVVAEHRPLAPVAQVERGEEFFKRWGVWSIFIGRFFGPLRAVIPLIAGTFEMPWLPFQIANWTSAFVWAFVLLAPGAAALKFLS